MKEWVDDHQISVPKPLKLVPIESGEQHDGIDVLVEDVKPILGYPYLFQHANDCEHLVVFMDIRLINLDDPQHPDDYPLLSNKPNPRRVICKVCQLYSAKWETRHDELSDEDPSFWCEKCFKTFHYDESGAKSHSFLAKPFVDPAIMYGNLGRDGNSTQHQLET